MNVNAQVKQGLHAYLELSPHFTTAKPTACRIYLYMSTHISIF